MNYINRISNYLHSPDTYHRRYDLDLVVKAEVGSSMDIARRVGLTILPFLSLYRPAGMAMSVGLGSCRLISNLASAFSAQEWAGVGSALALSACSVASLAATVFNSTVGLFVSTISDIGVGCSQMLQLGWSGEYAKGMEEGAQTLASALYLGFMVTGVLEVILVSVVVQAALSLYQAKGEIEQGHYIEALGKGALACVQGYQVHEYWKSIQQRDALCEELYQPPIDEIAGFASTHCINEGTLQKTRDYVYVKLDDGYLTKIFTKIKESNPHARMASFRGDVGPHFSVIRHDEWRGAPPQEISELGNKYLFTPLRVDVIQTAHKKLWVLIVEPSSMLVDLRERCAVGSRPHGHEFHVTIAQSAL